MVRGKVSVQGESFKIVLGLEPEGSAYCVLSLQDSSELAQIIAEEARIIWEASETSTAKPAQIEGSVHEACSLWTEPGLLKVIAHDSEALIALIFDSGTECTLDVTRAAALVQILEYMSDAIKKRSFPKR